MAEAAQATPAAPLKRLGFVRSTYEKASSTILEPLTKRATGLYAGLKDMTPSALKPGVDGLEGAIKFYVAPLVSKAQESAPGALATLDGHVDSLVVHAQESTPGVALAKGASFFATVRDSLPGSFSALDEQRQRFQGETVAQVRAQAKSLFAAVESGGKYIAETVKDLPAGAYARLTGALGEARAALASPGGYTAATVHAVAANVSAAWDAFLAATPVASVRQSMQPVATEVKARYDAIARGVLSSPMYASVMKTATQGFEKYVAPSPVYQSYVQPYVHAAQGTQLYTTAVNALVPGPVEAAPAAQAEAAS